MSGWVPTTSSAVIVRVSRSITFSLFSFRTETNAVLPFGVTSTSLGRLPTPMLSSIVPVVTSTAAISFVTSFVTYTVFPSRDGYGA